MPQPATNEKISISAAKLDPLLVTNAPPEPHHPQSEHLPASGLLFQASARSRRFRSIHCLACFRSFTFLQTHLPEKSFARIFYSIGPRDSSRANSSLLSYVFKPPSDPPTTAHAADPTSSRPNPYNAPPTTAPLCRAPPHFSPPASK